MKFAVVEYTSKSGGVWRHQDKLPNFLADPATAIDPTSFGCYVSALRGEHVPLTGLIVGELARIGWLGVKTRKAIKRLTGNWPFNYSIEYLLKFDVLMVVHQLSDAHEMVRLIAKVKSRRPDMVIIGVPTQPYGILKAVVDEHEDKKKELVDFIRSCDVFISVVKETVGWYEKLANRKVVYMPQPYPYLFTKDYFAAQEAKAKTVLVAGVTQRDNIRQGQEVAIALQKKFPDYRILVPKVGDLDYDEEILNGAKYEMLKFESWRDHLKTLGGVSLVINTDYTLTRGRVQTDCAAVGTPCIGANSDGQKDLYPDLYNSDGFSTEELIRQGEKLLSDAAYYSGIANGARSELEKYNYGQTAERLTKLVATVKV